MVYRNMYKNWKYGHVCRKNYSSEAMTIILPTCFLISSETKGKLDIVLRVFMAHTIQDYLLMSTK